ncbi:MAG: hypothetical protein KDC71_18420 [Acidobacteria bacterium]|nr:hypothetical protein [Acidobacteriota bacterium]
MRLVLFLIGLHVFAQSLEVQNTGILIAEKDFQLPKGTIHIQNGLFAPVTLKWGELAPLTIGYVQLSGESSASIRFETAMEGRAAHYNLDGVELTKRSGLNAEMEGNIIKTMTIKGRGLWFSSILFQGESQSLDEKEFNQAKKVLSHFQDNRNSVYYPTELCPDPEMGAYAATANGQNFIYWSLLDTGSPYAYFFDGFRTLQHGIVVFNELDSITRQESHFLSSALPDLHQPQYPNLTVTALKGDISSPDNRQINFNLDVTYVEPLGGIRILYFDLMSSRTAMREKNKHVDQHQLNFGSITSTRIGQEGNPDQDNFGALTVLDLVQYKHDDPDSSTSIQSIKNAEGKELPHYLKSDALLVDLGTATTQNQPFTLHFEYGGRLLAQDLGMEMVHWDGYAWFPRGLLHWARPTLDLNITVQSPWLAIGPGVQKRTSEGKQNKVHLLEQHPVSHPNLFLGKYHEFEYETQKKTARYYSYAQNRKSSVGNMHKLTEQFLGFYSQILGVIPYEEFSIIETKDFMQPHHQTSGLLVFTSETFERFSASQRAKQAADTNTYIGINETLAIGLASLWWSGQVQPATAQEEWFNYAFPEYCAYLMMKLSKKADAEDKFPKRWQARADYVKDLPIALADSLVDHHQTNVQWDLKRSKSAMLLSEIHKKLGDQGLINLFNGFLRITNFKTPINLNFAQATGSVSKNDERAFFEHALWGFEP